MREPSATAGLTLDAADAYCRFLTGRHYENFSVASAFVDRNRRTDLARLYAFCRTTDDLGDESADRQAVPRLERWRSELIDAFAGTTPVHPVLYALARTAERRTIPAQPFLDLIEANLMDQRVSAYESWPDLLAYCMLSAAPVGRMVLLVFGIANAENERLSDDVCVGLQLANHAQDVSRDRRIGRSYLLQKDVRDGGTAFAVESLVGRARTLLDSGKILERRAPMALRLQLALYRLGGRAICDAIERVGYQTENVRPSVSTPTKLALAVRALAAG
ncbi:MAG TPA: squalene/phytoene synthase family protein [Candidatus Tumulicola sp.]